MTDGGGNFLRCGPALSPSQKSLGLINSLYFATGGERQIFIGTKQIQPDPKKSTRVRLQRKGIFLHLSFKQDGAEWFEYFPRAVPEWPKDIKVGVVALNTATESNGKAPFSVTFSDPVLTTP